MELSWFVFLSLGVENRVKICYFRSSKRNLAQAKIARNPFYSFFELSLKQQSSRLSDNNLLCFCKILAQVKIVFLK